MSVSDYTDVALVKVMKAGELIEIKSDGPVDSSIQEIFHLCRNATEALERKYSPSVRGGVGSLVLCQS